MPAISAKTLDALRGPILSILRKSDLASISAKKVRTALVKTPADAMQGDVGSDVSGPRLLPRLGVDIEDKVHKKAIDNLIRQCFDTISEESQARPSSVTQTNGTPKLALPGMGGVPGSLSTSNNDTAPPSSAASSSAPLKKRPRADDDGVNSSEEDADAETISKIAKKSKANAKVAPKKKKTKSADAGDKEKKPPNPNNPFNRPVILSDEMSKVCGGKEVS
jgi:upstream activation factor subunit UAF30